MQGHAPVPDSDIYAAAPSTGVAGATDNFDNECQQTAASTASLAAHVPSAVPGPHTEAGQDILVSAEAAQLSPSPVPSSSNMAGECIGSVAQVSGTLPAAHGYQAGMVNPAQGQIEPPVNSINQPTPIVVSHFHALQQPEFCPVFLLGAYEMMTTTGVRLPGALWVGQMPNGTMVTMTVPGAQ